MSGGSGGDWLMCSGVCVLSGGCLEGVWGVSWRCQGCLMVSGGVRWCLGGVHILFGILKINTSITHLCFSSMPLPEDL